MKIYDKARRDPTGRQATKAASLPNSLPDHHSAEPAYLHSSVSESALVAALRQDVPTWSGRTALEFSPHKIKDAPHSARSVSKIQMVGELKMMPTIKVDQQSEDNARIHTSSI